MNLRRAVAALLLIIVSGAGAHAHSVAVYVSTPVSPPAGFQWVFWASMGALLATNTVLIRVLRFAAWPAAVARATVTTACFAGLFWLFGRAAALLSTGPPPGLGWGERVLWGLDRDEAWRLFLWWNFLGILFLTGSLWLLGGLRGRVWTRPGASLMLANALVYFLSVTPYARTGALAHGWTGYYVYRACLYNLQALGTATLSYARAHGGRFPEGHDTGTVFLQIKPFLDPKTESWHETKTLCPAEKAFERNPRPYLWNRELAGKALAELRQLQGHVPVFSCPHHVRTGDDEGLALYTWDILYASGRPAAEGVELKYRRGGEELEAFAPQLARHRPPPRPHVAR